MPTERLVLPWPRAAVPSFARKPKGPGRTRPWPPNVSAECGFPTHSRGETGRPCRNAHAVLTDRVALPFRAVGFGLGVVVESASHCPEGQWQLAASRIGPSSGVDAQLLQVVLILPRRSRRLMRIPTWRTTAWIIKLNPKWGWGSRRSARGVCFGRRPHVETAARFQCGSNAAMTHLAGTRSGRHRGRGLRARACSSSGAGWAFVHGVEIRLGLPTN